MASSKYYSFLNFLFCCILLEQSILNCNVLSEGCGPTCEANQKMTVELFFPSDTGKTEYDNLCVIIKGSNGLIKVVNRMGTDISVNSKGEVVCSSEEQCYENRYFACFYKYHQDKYDDCDKDLPPVDQQIEDCIKDGLADDILVANKKAYDNYKATVNPALVVDGKFYSCFTDYSLASMQRFFCNAYNDGLEVCSGGLA